MPCVSALTRAAAGRAADTRNAPCRNEATSDLFRRLLAARLRERGMLELAGDKCFPAPGAQRQLPEQTVDMTRGVRELLLRQAMTAISALIGRYVVASHDGIEVAGPVDQALAIHGQMKLVVDSTEVTLDAIGRVQP